MLRPSVGSFFFLPFFSFFFFAFFFAFFFFFFRNYSPSCEPPKRESPKRHTGTPPRFPRKSAESQAQQGG